MRARVVANWVAVAAATLTIWTLGSEGASREATFGVITPVLGSILPGTSPRLLSRLHRGIRKLAHTAEYGALGLLVLRATLVTWPLPLAHAAAVTLAFVLVLGAADETRQALSGTRVGAASDVLLDVAGAWIVLAAVQLLPPRARWTLIPRRE
jgi:VanZ family protein